jgi:AcrR family transcriptional regulator
MGDADEGEGAPAPVQGTRERLLDLAAQVFADEGYATASVRDLAKRSGVTSGAIYGNFAGKADLLVAAVAAQVRRQMEVVPPPGLERLDEVLADVFLRYPERRALRALLLEGAVAGRGENRRAGSGPGRPPTPTSRSGATWPPS